VIVNALGVGTGVVGEHERVALAVGAAAAAAAAATAYAVTKAAMCCRFGAVVVVVDVGTEPEWARCDLVARSLVLQVAC